MEIYNYFITLNQSGDSHHIHCKHTKTNWPFGQTKFST